MKNTLASLVMMVVAILAIDTRLYTLHKRAFWYSLHIWLYAIWHALFHQATSQAARWSGKFRVWYYVDKPRNRRDWGSYTSPPAVWFWRLENLMAIPFAVRGPLHVWIANQYKFEPKRERSLGFQGDEA